MDSRRDLRIDFFRGLALLIVLVDHIEDRSGTHLVIDWTLVGLGFSDAAEVFVFLSGFVFGKAYSRRMDAEGLAACMRHALVRTAQIYLAYQLALWAVMIIGAAFMAYNPPSDDGLRVGDQFWQCIELGLWLEYQPHGFPMLAFYIVTLPFMPLVLALARRWPLAAWGLSLAMYLAVVVRPEINLYRFPDDQTWIFNPFAWQFLFCSAMLLAITRFDWNPGRWRILFVALAAAVLLLGLFVMKFARPLINYDENYRAWLQPLLDFKATWNDKNHLGPLRLVHFFSLVYLVSLALPSTLACWSRGWARPLVRCGQHSLETYAFGLVLTFVSALVMNSVEGSHAVLLFLELDACLLSIGFASLYHDWRRPKSAVAG